MPQKTNSEWTDELIGLLGTMSDRDFSARFALTVAQVRFKRRALKIARFSPLKNIPDGLMPLLGKFPDTDIAKKTGLSLHKIRSIREAYDIPACYHQRGTTQRIDRINQMLAEGKSVDEVAREMKIPAERLRKFISKY
jgi:hypothetical protein